jgi:hypothetical protein
MMFIEEKDEIHLCVPIRGSTTPNLRFIYNISKDSWSRGERQYSGYGYYETKSAPTWDEATDAWDSYSTLKWDDSTLLALSPLNLLGTTTGVVVKGDALTHNLAGVKIDGWWDTKDFVVGEGYQREITNWMELNFEGRGNSVDIWYSTNEGSIYTFVKTVALTSEWKLYNVDFEVNSVKIRFRFRNNNKDETFQLRMLEIGYISSTSRGKE